MKSLIKKIMFLALIGLLSSCDRDRLPTGIESMESGQIVLMLEAERPEAELASIRTDSSNIPLKKEKSEQPSPRLSAVNQLEVRVLKADNSSLTTRSFTASEGRLKGTIEVKAQNDLKVLCIGKNSGVVERYAIDDDVDVIGGRTVTLNLVSQWSAGYISRITSITPNPSTDGSYRVSWAGATGATRYILQEATSSSFTEARQAYSGSDRQASISGKSPGTYHYRVQATNSYNVTSDWSASSSVEVIVSRDTTPPDPVTDFLAVPGDRQVSLSWTNPTDQDYQGTMIRRADVPITSWKPTDGVEVYVGTDTNAVDMGLTNGTTYYYTAFTFDADSNYCTPVNASATPESPPENNIKITDGTGSRGSDVTLQVLATSDRDIVGASFDLAFDVSMLQVKSVSLGSANSTMRLSTNVEEANTSGILKVSMVDFSISNPVAAGTDREILLVTYTISADASGDTPLTLSNLELSDESAGNIPASAVEGTVFVETPPPGEILMVPIHAGNFQMGSDPGEQPVHTVTFDYSFEMSATEITQAQYEEAMGTNPSSFTGDNNRPVENVSWNNAVTFCNALSEAEGLEPCYDLSTWECDFSKNGYRLPTEAEWEYACRAGTTTNYNTGDSESDLDRAGWYKSNSGNTTHAVGGQEANSYDLYDMHGNVSEWCNDRYGVYSSESQTNPTGPEDGSDRVIRGGSWYSEAINCRSAFRYHYSTDFSNHLIGFRVVRGVIPAPSTEITMVPIPADNFQMGSTTGDPDEQPVHTVTLDYSFQMSATEITQAQYEEAMGTNPSFFTGDNNRPVEQVSWYDAVTFCNRLSEAAGLEPCYDLSTWECDFSKNGYRLPTEAEWEYACRAGTTTNYNTGDSESDLDRAGWYDVNSGGTTHPVGQKDPNAWGLYDMHGNVWERCNDWYGVYSSESQTNPTGPESGSIRVARGGSALNIADFSRSAYRSNYAGPDYTSSVSGFRVVRRL
jgi:formylglycine-generating enzyme required for sulfatase activity